MAQLQGLSHLGPVCALRCVEDSNIVLCGEGPLLKVFNFKTGKEIAERLVFPRNKIHGIEVCSSAKTGGRHNVAIFGGRSLTIVSLDCLQTSRFPQLSVGDWIIDVEFSPDGTELYCLTAHNDVVTINLEKMTLAAKSNCLCKSILYSGAIRVMPDGRVLVCAGTVMHGVLCWDLGTRKMLYRFTEHDGAIFEVEVSSDGKWLISCSDDRSIRVFDLVAGELCATGWGHTSRIWSLCIYDYTGSGSFGIFSSSEDCTARTWRFTQGQPNLVQLSCMTCHTGRNIWSAAVNDNLKVGFTGGADGKVKSYDLAPGSRSGYLSSRWNLQSQFTKGEYILLHYDYEVGLLVVTSKGRFFAAPKFEEWQPIFEDSHFSSSVVVSGSKARMVVLGNRSGVVLALAFDAEGVFFAKSNIDVPLDRIGSIHVDGMHVLYGSPNPSDGLICQEMDGLKVVSSVTLTKPPESIFVTCMAYIPAADSILVGSRNGWIVLYNLKESRLVAYYKYPVKGSYVSCLKIVPNTGDDITFYLTMENGLFSLQQIDGETKQFKTLEDNRLPKGALCGVIQDTSGGDIVTYGFQSDAFVLWNDTKQYELAHIPCAGGSGAAGSGRLNWTLDYWWTVKDQLRYRLVLSRKYEVEVVQNGVFPYNECLVTGMHGREVRDMVVLDGGDLDGGDLDGGDLVVSGGEDTFVKLSKLQPDGRLELLWTQTQHGSGFQSLHKLKNNYVMSSASREELYLWKVHRDLKGRPSMSLCRTVKPSSKHPDLRVMDFDTVPLKDGTGFVLVAVYSDSQIRIWCYNYKLRNFQPIVEGRYAECCLLHVRFVRLGDALYMVVAATNGCLIVYKVDLSPSFELSGSGLEPELVLLAPVVPGGTASRLGNPATSLQVHQSSVKALDVYRVNDVEVKLVTGGDDNALKTSLLSLEAGNPLFTPEASVTSAAASTITSVKIVQEKHCALSVSSDQKIRLWSLDDLSLVSEAYTTVADTGCMALAAGGSGRLLIGGAGISVWKVL